MFLRMDWILTLDSSTKDFKEPKDRDVLALVGPPFERVILVLHGIIMPYLHQNKQEHENK